MIDRDEVHFVMPAGRAPTACVSGSAVRMFLNIADRWELSQVDRFMLLECNEQQFEEWSSIARSHGPLVLETAVLMRVSAVLGVFAELRHLFASADQERGWLTCVHTAAPFGRRAPLDLLRGSLEDQLAVRRYAESIERRVSSSNDDDLDSTPYRVVSEETRPQIRAVCFDGFGTLVDIGDRRRPLLRGRRYHRAARLLPCLGHPGPRPDYRRRRRQGGHGGGGAGLAAGRHARRHSGW